MSFEKITFTYTPPPTVSSPTPLGTGDQAYLAAGTGDLYTQSRAGQLLSRLADLRATAQYLEDCVSASVPGMGVRLDPATDPAVAVALSRIFSTETNIQDIDLGMYQSMLKAEETIQRLDIQLDPSSSLMVSPIQRADLNLVTKSFEKALVADGSFEQQLLLLLRPLSGDRVIFDDWSKELKDYPILQNQDPQDTDLGAGLSQTMNGFADRWEAAYAQNYKIMAQPDPVSLGASAVLATLVGSTLKDLVLMGALLSSLQSQFHKQKMGDLTDSLVGVVFPRLISDLSRHGFQLDRFVAKALASPALQTGGLGQLMSSLRLLGKPGTVLSQNLTNALSPQTQGTAKAKKKPASAASVRSLPQGVKVLGATLNWSVDENKRQSAAVQANMEKAVDRRLHETGDRLEILTHLKSLSALSTLIKGLQQTSKAGSATSVPLDPTQNLQAFGQVLNGLDSTTGTTYTVGEDGELLPTPAELPAAPPEVAALLRRGGVDLNNTNQFNPVMMGAPSV